jgi:hypothetical protein
MPSPHNSASERLDRSRRRLVAVAAGAIVAGTAGCVSSLESTPASESTTDAPTDTEAPTTNSTTRAITDEGTYADTVPGPESYPSRPDDADESNAVAYAEDFEYARTYNSLHEDDVEDLSASASARHVTAAHDGHYAITMGSGYANYADDVHADWGQQPALFYVSPDLAVRVGDYEHYYDDCEDVYASDDPAENIVEPCEGGTAAIRLVNSHPDAHELDVSITHQDAAGTPEVFADEYFLGTSGGVTQESITYRRGTYRIAATADTDATATAEWELTSEQAYDDPIPTVVIEPTGGLTIRNVRFTTN